MKKVASIPELDKEGASWGAAVGLVLGIVFGVLAREQLVAVLGGGLIIGILGAMVGSLVHIPQGGYR